MSKKTTIIVVAYPDRGVGNDPIFLCVCVCLGGGGSLLPPRLNIFTVGNTGVMICLGQGGLRSLCVLLVYGIFLLICSSWKPRLQPGFDRFFVMLSITFHGNPFTTS